MQLTAPHRQSDSLFALLALLSILLAPIAALSQQVQPAAAAVASGTCNACLGHEQSPQSSQQDQQDDNCCTSAACACACHAPLAVSSPVVPLPEMTTNTHPAIVPQKPPQVYLSIFVPPQNRS